eukprot:scaffold148013_cov38-Prasinocladus_malaysianus.AAC.1
MFCRSRMVDGSRSCLLAEISQGTKVSAGRSRRPRNLSSPSSSPVTGTPATWARPRPRRLPLWRRTFS